MYLQQYAPHSKSSFCRQHAGHTGSALSFQPIRLMQRVPRTSYRAAAVCLLWLLKLYLTVSHRYHEVALLLTIPCYGASQCSPRILQSRCQPTHESNGLTIWSPMKLITLRLDFCLALSIKVLSASISCPTFGCWPLWNKCYRLVKWTLSIV